VIRQFTRNAEYAMILTTTRHPFTMSLTRVPPSLTCDVCARKA
jgi:hypothetical protein